MRVYLLLLSLIVLSTSQTATAQELSQGQLRTRLLESFKSDFARHVKTSGLNTYISKNKVPMTLVDRKFRQVADKQFDAPISTLEAKLLVRYPQHIPRIRAIHKLSYSLTEKICRDEEAEGNETDSARHFVAGFALALLTGEKFAHQYLTAHEGWLLDQNLDEYTGYHFASGIMDLYNNVIGIVAARKHKSLSGLNLAKVRALALQELKQARKDKKLISVYAKDGACSQASQREKFRKRLGLSSQTAIW